MPTYYCASCRYATPIPSGYYHCTYWKSTKRSTDVACSHYLSK